MTEETKIDYVGAIDIMDSWWNGADSPGPFKLRLDMRMVIKVMGDMLADIEKQRNILSEVERMCYKLQLCKDDFYQGYIDEIEHMSGWEELREAIQDLADNNFYG